MNPIKELDNLDKEQLKQLASNCLYWQEKYYWEVTSGKTDSNGAFYMLQGAFKNIRSQFKLPPFTNPQP